VLCFVCKNPIRMAKILYLGDAFSKVLFRMTDFCSDWRWTSLPQIADSNFNKMGLHRLRSGEGWFKVFNGLLDMLGSLGVLWTPMSSYADFGDESLLVSPKIDQCWLTCFLGLIGKLQYMFCIYSNKDNKICSIWNGLCWISTLDLSIKQKNEDLWGI